LVINCLLLIEGTAIELHLTDVGIVEPLVILIRYDMIYLTAIGLTPTGSNAHLHTNNT